MHFLNNIQLFYSSTGLSTDDIVSELAIHILDALPPLLKKDV